LSERLTRIDKLVSRVVTDTRNTIELCGHFVQYLASLRQGLLLSEQHSPDPSLEFTTYQILVRLTDLLLILWLRLTLSLWSAECWWLKRHLFSWFGGLSLVYGLFPVSKRLIFHGLTV
jgi:hypothetical protein